MSDNGCLTRVPKACNIFLHFIVLLNRLTPRKGEPRSNTFVPTTKEDLRGTVLRKGQYMIAATRFHVEGTTYILPQSLKMSSHTRSTEGDRPLA